MTPAEQREFAAKQKALRNQAGGYVTIEVGPQTNAKEKEAHAEQNLQRSIDAFRSGLIVLPKRDRAAYMREYRANKKQGA